MQPNDRPDRSRERRLIALLVAGFAAAAAAAQTATPDAPPVDAPTARKPMVLGLAGCGDKEGRPFTVAEVPRTAPARVRGEWAADIALDPSGLTDAERARVGAHFLRSAAAEHASVASFHRFGMELMQLGAPPALLLDALAAGADEVRHARLAYGIAAAVGTTTHGPGSLDVHGALDMDLSPRGVMRRLVDEACIVETIAAVEVRTAASRTADPTLRALLSGIADDEERHAQLGWRALRWLLTEWPELTTEAVARLSAVAPTAAASPATGLPAWGVLSAADRADARRRALASIIRPAAAALVAPVDDAAVHASA